MEGRQRLVITRCRPFLFNRSFLTRALMLICNPGRSMRGLCALCLGVVALVMTSGASAASPQELIRDVALSEAEVKATAIRALGSSGDPTALTLLQALLDGEVQTVDDKHVLLIKGHTATDLLTGKVVT